MAEALMIAAIYLLPLFVPMIIIAFLAEDVIPYFRRKRAQKARRDFR
jgi:hypothetical protein